MIRFKDLRKGERMLKAVIFDFGGVISTSCWDPIEIGKIIMHVFSKYGKKLPSNFPKIFQEVSDKIFDKMRETDLEYELKDFFIAALLKTGVEFENDVLEEALEVVRSASFCKIREEALPVLQKLKEMNLKVGLISNTPDVHPLRAILRDNLYDYFDAIVLSCWTRIRKPHPGIFKIALRKLDIDPSEAIYVGDIPKMDILGAQNAGIRAVWIKAGESYWVGKGVTTLPEDIKPDFVINNLWDLVELVMTLS